MGGKDGRGGGEVGKVSTYLYDLTEFLTKYCMVAYECNV